MPSFSIRPAELERSDHELLLDFWDSQIPWLSSKGSSGQWGTQSIRTSRPEAIDRAFDFVTRSLEIGEWGPDWCRAFIAEAGSPSSSHDCDGSGDRRDALKTPVAGLVLTAKSPDCVRSVLPQQDGAEPFVYVTYLMSNRRAGDLAKGAGAFLIAFAKDQARLLGVTRLCLDCYSGNDRKLVKYAAHRD